MKNILHFGQVKSISASDAGELADSGNGYYSYDYYLLPYSGVMTPEAKCKVGSILHKRHYSYPFTSLGSTFKVTPNADNTGGTILYSVTYHHGD